MRLPPEGGSYMGSGGSYVVSIGISGRTRYDFRLKAEVTWVPAEATWR